MSQSLYTLIIYPLVQIIEFSYMLFFSLFKNEGISVIGVSFAVSILCLPLYIVAEKWQQIQRDTEKTLEKGIARIKKSFTGDERYMILTTFYKENHYHPLMALRSSFGLLIQIPFFIAAYNFLSSLTAIKGVSFWFIKDLGVADSFFSIKGFDVNILPIAMTLINIVAGAIYTKGFKFKDKIQIYAMALIFLVILYNSPSGLVLYWTMNNVFSLVKNIFYKIKKPQLTLYILLVICVLFLDYYVAFIHTGNYAKRAVMGTIATLLLLAPLFVKVCNNALNTIFAFLVNDRKTKFALFITSCIALCLLAGFVIPSFVVNSSVVEFADIDNYASPLYFLGNTTLQVAGITLFWSLCIYFLFSSRIQTLLAVFMPIVLFVSITNAFCFSGNYGTLSKLITFSQGITNAGFLLNTLNIICILAIIFLVIILFKYKKIQIISAVTVIVLISECCISLVHLVQIQSEYNQYKKNIAHQIQTQNSITAQYHVSKTKKNVFVFMLDRAESAYVQQIFEAYPELYDNYDGFIFYPNTISYNQSTLLASPPLYGGYEYTPYETNKRDTEKLVDKHNEALLLLPRIFTEQSDFEATVSDLSWANYSWIPDMSICSNYPKINGINVQRKYTSLWIKQNVDKVKENITSSALKRNFAWFSLFKISPLVMRDSIYQQGFWWAADTQTSDVMDFLDYYSAIDFLKELTDFSSNTNSYFTIVNETTHEDTNFDDININIDEMFLYKNKEIAERISSYRGIEGNILVYKKLGEWLEYLKQNGCYDNSRIILVSDHGMGSTAGKNLTVKDNWQMDFNPIHTNPLLMVKDFNSNGKLRTDFSFMTNADVPAIATKDIIENPKNPFTGKQIKEIPSTEKKAIGVTTSYNWRPEQNKINTFVIPNEDWYTVCNNLFEEKNWQQGVYE